MADSPLPRSSAAAINPLISSLFPADTLSQVSSVLHDLGHILSILSMEDDPPLAHLYLICDAASAALAYEMPHVHLTTLKVA